MFGYSNTSNVVFILRPKEISSIAVLKVKVDTKLLSQFDFAPLKKVIAKNLKVALE